MIRSVQSLRFVFIMLVVMSHIYGKAFDFGGECGVAFFFVLSGFILSYAYHEQVIGRQFEHGRFLKRQLLKFYPLHLLTFIIMVLLDARLGVFFHWTKLVANLLLLQSWVPSDSFYFVANGLSWFLSDLLFFYVAFPLACRFLLTKPLRTLTIVSVIVLTAYVCLAVMIPDNMVNPLLYASPATRLIDFCIGILLFRFYKSERGSRTSDRISQMTACSQSALELLTVGMLVASFFVYELSPKGFRCASLFWIISPVVLYVFVSGDKGGGIVTRLLHHPMMLWLGGLTLEIYLIHWIVMRVFYSILLPYGIGEEERLLLPTLLATILIIIMAAWLTKRLFVQPIYTTLTKKTR